MMKTSEIIDGLEDLIQDRKSFVTPANDKFYGKDNPFKYDIAVLKAAIDKLSRRAEPVRPDTKTDELIKELRNYGLSDGSSLGRHIGIMDEAADRLEELNCRTELENKLEENQAIIQRAMKEIKELHCGDYDCLLPEGKLDDSGYWANDDVCKNCTYGTCYRALERSLHTVTPENEALKEQLAIKSEQLESLRTIFYEITGFVPSKAHPPENKALTCDECKFEEEYPMTSTCQNCSRRYADYYAHKPEGSKNP